MQIRVGRKAYRVGQIKLYRDARRIPTIQTDNISEQRLLEKIRQLLPEQVLQVEGFIDSLYQQNLDDGIILAAAKLSEPVLHRIWDNPDDAEYDQLGIW